MTTKKEYGLLIERRLEYGTDYIVVSVTSREGDHPYGCSSDGERSWDNNVPKHVHGLQLDGLCMHGFVSDFNDFAYIGYQPEYRGIHSADLGKCTRMVRTLKKVYATLEKEKAHEPGDVFTALARSLKLTFVCEPVGKREYGVAEWRFMGIADGRNRFRNLIEETQAEMRERKAA